MKQATLVSAWLIFGMMLGVVAITAPHPAAADSLTLTRGQTLYVPVYSHIYIGDREMQFYLATTLSVRNTDPEAPIRVTAVDYHDSEGARIKAFLTAPKTLQPLATKRIVIKESDKTGGSGAKFIVSWEADKPVVQPIVESVMISTRSNQGISFVSRGQVIREAD